MKSFQDQFEVLFGQAKAAIESLLPENRPVSIPEFYILTDPDNTLVVEIQMINGKATAIDERGLHFNIDSLNAPSDIMLIADYLLTQKNNH